jgi:hypothetical protein
MTIPSYTFLLRDAAKPATERAFMDVVLSTRRFWRNEKSQIMYEVAPGDYCLVERKLGLRSILNAGEVMRLDGDVDESTFDSLWFWITANKWKLPRLNPNLPFDPPAPLPVRNVGVRR